MSSALRVAVTGDLHHDTQGGLTAPDTVRLRVCRPPWSGIPLLQANTEAPGTRCSTPKLSSALRIHTPRVGRAIQVYAESLPINSPTPFSIVFLMQIPGSKREA